MAGLNMIQLKNISRSSSISSTKEQQEQLSAICLSKRSTSSPGASGECYYYSTCKFKFYLVNLFCTCKILHFNQP